MCHDQCMKIDAYLCGSGFIEWENRSTGEVEQKYKISVRNDRLGRGLPDIYPCDDHVVVNAGTFAMGDRVSLTIRPNRYKQMHVVDIASVGKEAH